VLSLILTLACKHTPAPTPQPVVLPIAALNDWHGGLYEEPVRGEEGRVAGGLPWLVGTMDALRAQHPDLVVLDGGDIFQGAWPVNASKGAGAVAAYGLLGVDAAAVGNHEFDYGGSPTHPLRGALMDAAAHAPFSWLTANITEADGTPWAPPGIAAAAIIERDGVRLGVIGLTTTETPQTTLPGNVADLRFTDPVQAIRDALPALQGVDAVAVVGHLTGSCSPPDLLTPEPGCRPDGEIGRILDELPPGTVDVMVLGHAHTLLSGRVDDTFLLESRDRGQLIGRLDLVIGPDGVDPDASILHPPIHTAHAPSEPGCEGGAFNNAPQVIGGMTVTPSTRALALVRSLEEQAGSLCDELGCVTQPLTRSRTASSAVGALAADAMLAAFPDADLALQNSGGLRSDIAAGTLRRADLQAVMPFDNRLLLVELTGDQLALLLRIGSSGAHGILQIAGGRYGLDPARTGGDDIDGDGAIADWEQDRLCFVEVGGQPVQPDRTYAVVTTDFLYAGGDHLGPALTGAPISQQGPLLREALFEHAAAQTACIAPDPTPRVILGACP
jgi:5'-nucleotidase